MANYKYPNARARKRALDKSNRKYKREKQTAFVFRFHNVNDANVISKLKSVPNKIGYVRELINADIEKERN